MTLFLFSYFRAIAASAASSRHLGT